jgi:hypothetical protein
MGFRVFNAEAVNRLSRAINNLYSAISNLNDPDIQDELHSIIGELESFLDEADNEFTPTSGPCNHSPDACGPWCDPEDSDG